MRRNSFGVEVLVVLCAFAFSNKGSARDVSRYPSERPNFSANIVGSFNGVYNGFLPLEVQLGLDPTFTEQQQTLLKSAMKLFVERGLSARVIDCALQKASKDLPESPTKLKTQLLSAMTLITRQEMMLPSFAFVGRYWDDSNSVGLAYVGLFNDVDWPFPGFENRHYLHIAINSDFLGDGKNYYYRNDVDYWAGVLAHEFLHNLGYRHPTGYERSFIYEYGNCVRNNGLEGAPLLGEVHDRAVEKDL